MNFKCKILSQKELIRKDKNKLYIVIILSQNDK